MVVVTTLPDVAILTFLAEPNGKYTGNLERCPRRGDSPFMAESLRVSCHDSCERCPRRGDHTMHHRESQLGHFAFVPVTKLALVAELHLPVRAGNSDDLCVPAYLHHPEDGAGHALPPRLRAHHCRIDGRGESQDFLFRKFITKN